MRKTSSLYAGIALALVGASQAGAAPPARAVVLELFTSQGCSSCPPADALLTQLSADKSLLPLSFHVDYWDRLGWRDPFSLPESTARQNAYAAALGSHNVYTPQLIVDGRYDVIGSQAQAVEMAIAKARTHSTFAMVDIAPDATSVTITPMQGASAALVWVVYFAPYASTDVKNGENGGRRLEGINNVRAIKQLGQWDGREVLRYALVRAAAGEGLAVLVQSSDGTILGAARTP